MANYPYYNTVPYGQSQQYMRPSYMEQQPQPYIGIKGRPVSSIDEVRATSIDFDGSIFFFPDVANQKIYTKQINLDGTSTLNVYELRTQPIEPVINTAQFITRDEFETVINKLKEEQQQRKESTKLDF